jgi:predicted nucleic acid-binding protein
VIFVDTSVFMYAVGGALRLVDGCTSRVWEIEPVDVWFARDLVRTHPALGARDLVHLASCRRRGVDRIRTFDRGLAAFSREE